MPAVCQDTESQYPPLLYARIQTKIKNIIQLNVCDADPITSDDIQFIVLFDLSNVQPGNPVLEKFSLKPKARELSILDVKVNKEDNEKVLKANRNVVFSVQQSYEGTQKTSTNLDSFRFHCIKSFGPVLKVKTQNILPNEDSDSDYSLILPLKLLPVGYQGSTFDLYLQVMDWSQNLHVRLGYELCPDEQDYLCKRKKVVADALYKLFNLGEELQEDEANPTKLSEQQQALTQGQNPFPIYTAINVKQDHVSTFDFREWLEFNPYEVSFLKYGAQIRSEDFDSEFFMGRVVKKIPESRICYLEDENYSSIDYPATVYKPPSYLCGKLCEIFNDILTNRPLSGENHNFLQSFAFDKDYLHQKEFIRWSDTIFDTSSNKLTPNTSSLCLIDVGYFMNNSGISLLKPERNLDIIIFLDYEMSGILTQLKKTADYCEIQGIPFPKIHLSEKERKDLKECYIFSDEDNPSAPIVLCFPLVCCTFIEYSAPGVKRTPSEMKEGKVNLEKGTSPYQTLEITYTEEILDKLINLCSYNVLNSKNFIFQAIQNAIQKKRHSGPRNAK
ncbi:cytosolic phospholipase A2 beta-like [Crotalus adamanteus]|uniref:Cytosolic phospholipase A2 beta-like n=1 Tax=Crotalus adamanteus TaxID=8729 RepID=A0AAW1C5T6_CROAD